MKLGRLNKALSVLLIAGVLSCITLGAEVTSVQQVATDTSGAVSQEIEEGAIQVAAEAEVLESEEKEIQFMRQYGEAVNISTVKDNIKITVEYMLSDAYTVKLLISVERLNGQPFKVKEGLQIKRVNLDSKEELEMKAAVEAIPEDASFVERLKILAQFNEELKVFIKEDNTVDQEGLVAYFQTGQGGEGVSTGTGSSSYGLCYTKENTNSKVYFTYEDYRGEPFDEKIVLSIQSIVEEKERSEEIAVDLADYLTKHQGEVLKTVPNVRDEYEIAHMEELKQTNKALYISRKEEMENQPQTLLDEQGLGLSLIEGDSSLVIDNIGFIEGKLHILMLAQEGNRYHLQVYDKADEWVSGSYHTGSSSLLEDGTKKNVEYRVYDIGSLEELKNYKFKVSGREIISEWQGPWEIDLNRGSDNGQVIKVGKMIPYTVTEEAKLSELYIGEGSVALYIDEIKGEISNNNLAVKIKFKDGTEKELTHNSASRRQRDKEVLVYSLRGGRGREIQSITVSDRTIYSAS